jgi:sporulation protein YlmC with PRC-barrel domain
MTDDMTDDMTGKRTPAIDAHLRLLDRQILDPDGRMVAKVDDVELEERPDGRLAVTALLTGPGALGPRWGGAIGAISSRTWARLTGNASSDTNRIDYSQVAHIGTAITLNVSRATAAVDGFEVWVRTRIIAGLPGSGKDPE